MSKQPFAGVRDAIEDTPAEAENMQPRSLSMRPLDCKPRLGESACRF